MIFEIIISLLLLIELFCGYQLMSFLFANNIDIYIKEINNQKINMEIFILSLAVIGLIQSISIIINYMNKTLKDKAIPALDIAKKQTNYLIYFMALLILASIGINIYLIYLYNDIQKGKVAIIKDNETFNNLQKLIPTTIILFVILFGLSLTINQ